MAMGNKKRSEILVQASLGNQFNEGVISGFSPVAEKFGRGW